MIHRIQGKRYTNAGGLIRLTRSWTIETVKRSSSSILEIMLMRAIAEKKKSDLNIANVARRKIR